MEAKSQHKFGPILSCNTHQSFFSRRSSRRTEAKGWSPHRRASVSRQANRHSRVNQAPSKSMCPRRQKASAKSRRVIRNVGILKELKLFQPSHIARRRRTFWLLRSLQRETRKQLLGSTAKSHGIAMAGAADRLRLLCHENNYIIGFSRDRFF